MSETIVNTQVVIVMDGGVVDHVAVLDGEGRAIPFREVHIDYDVERDEKDDDIFDLPQPDRSYAKARIFTDDVVEPIGVDGVIQGFLTENGFLKERKP